MEAPLAGASQAQPLDCEPPPNGFSMWVTVGVVSLHFRILPEPQSLSISLDKVTEPGAVPTAQGQEGALQSRIAERSGGEV